MSALTVFPPRLKHNQPFRAAGLGLYIDCEKVLLGWRYTVYRDFDIQLKVIHRERYLSWETAAQQLTNLLEALSRMKSESEAPSPNAEAAPSCTNLNEQIQAERRQREEWIQVLRDLRQQLP